MARKSRYTPEQIAAALRQAEAGTPVSVLARKLGVHENTFLKWRKRYGELGAHDVVGACNGWESRRAPYEAIASLVRNSTRPAQAVGGVVHNLIGRSDVSSVSAYVAHDLADLRFAFLDDVDFCGGGRGGRKRTRPRSSCRLLPWQSAGHESREAMLRIYPGTMPTPRPRAAAIRGTG